MGFRSRTFYVIGGNEDFPIGDNDELRRSRSEFILTKLSQALIDCNVGWELDTSKNITNTSYTNIPTRSGQKTYPALFFINTISGCKLFMSYFGDEIRNNGIKNFSGKDLVLYKGYDYHGGACCSIIPSGSSNVFGDPESTTFIPPDATRICGTYYNHVYYNNDMYSAAYNPIIGYVYLYSILATPYVVSPYSTYRTDSAIPYIMPSSNLIYATGKIFGYIFHDERNVNAKYGTYLIREESSPYESYALVINSDISVFGTTIKVPARSSNIANPYNICPSASISREDGSWILGGDSTTYNVVALCPNIDQLSIVVFSNNNSTKSRFIPIYLIYCSTNLETGVINGSGVKGIIDTDLFVCANCFERYTIFSDNKYINLESQNLLTGWDSLNLPIKAYWGDNVTIPNGYTVESVTLNVAYSFATYKDTTNSVVLVLGGKDQYSDILTSNMIQNYPPSTYPALEIFKGISISDSATPKMQGVRLTRGSSGGSIPFTVTNVDVNGTSSTYGDYFIYLQGTTSDNNIKNAVMSRYPARLFLQTDSSGNVNPIEFKLPNSLWSVTNGTFNWLGNTSDDEDLAYYYANDWDGQILFNINLIPSS